MVTVRDPETMHIINDAVPSWLVDVASVVTHMGDYHTVLFLGIAAGVFLVPSERSEVVMWGVAGGIIVVSILKAGIGLPRPPGAGMGGHGFPSGHAFGSTVVYLLLAREISLGPRLMRFALAATVVAVVASSRVVMGVHYPIDVVAGAALALVYLVGVLRFRAVAGRIWMVQPLGSRS